MQLKNIRVLATCAVLAWIGLARAAPAAEDADTIETYKRAMESGSFFDAAYAYAVFPTVGEGGLIVGAALGKGRVYVQGKLVGDAKLKQLSAGLQAGGKAYSEIIFFEDRRALGEFQSGTFEFSAGVSAIAITAGASASAGTSGATSGASGGFQKGLMVFTIAKGGLMYAATVAGQKFSYTPLATH